MNNVPPLAFVDIETTGSSPTGDRIIEIGILRVEDDEIVRTYETLINPHSYIPDFITEMTGIDSSKLKSAPDFADVQESIYEMLEGCVFVAHNARFDYGFVRNEFKRFGYTYTAKVLCTVKLSRMLFPEQKRHGLDIIIDRFGIECENRHRAFDDAKVMWEFMQKIRNDYPHLPLHDTIHHIIRQPSLPQHIDAGHIDGLDEIPGVYLFYGDTDLPLYIGKSVSLRNRVLSHFSGDHTSTTEMVIAQQVQRIETITTAGELGALILEAQLIKEKKPMYNRRLRAIEKMTVIKEGKDKDGYSIAVIKEQDHLSAEELKDVIHITGSKRKAKEFLETICKKNNLCKKMLGLEKTSSTCFDYKLGKCSGACCGNIKPALYNAQFKLVFDPVRIPLWPFDGPILVKEWDNDREVTDVFLFDKWCFLAKLTPDEVPDLDDTSHEYVFDLDTYKILKRYIQKKTKNIVRLK